MKNLCAGLALLFLALPAGFVYSQEDEEVGCIGCHLELDPPYSTPAEAFASDIHAQAGFTCETCHGGDPEAWDFDEAKDPAAGFIGVPTGRKIVELCSRCHSDPEFMQRYNPNLSTDQESKYWTSGHGRSLKRGIGEAAQCASCHGVHGIRRTGDPGSPVYPTNVPSTCGRCHSNPLLMDRFDVNYRVVEQYRNSVHGRALLERGDMAAPTCNNCHGNHAANPPEVESIQEVCGVCHVNNLTLFNQTKMRAMFATHGLHGCVVCHTAHNIQHPDDSFIDVTSDGVCSRCHEVGDAGSLQAETIHGILDSLNGALTLVEQKLRDAENRGLEVEDLLLEYQTAMTALIQSRTMVHTFDAGRVQEEAQPGMTLAEQIRLQAQEIFRDFRLRRIGLGVATLFISLLGVALYLYIRTLDQKDQKVRT